MRSRADTHNAFVARFHVGERGAPMTDQQIDTIEAALDTKLPAAYRQFMTRYGAVHTPGILDEIADRNIEHSDVQDFLEPQQAIEDTKLYWSAGMPQGVIGIASDCMGNMIGFHRQSTPTDDAPVVFFDHDFVEVYELASSFDDFLTWYLDYLR
jgi:SMI1 / KNR4 family (SUKH-1)